MALGIYIVLFIFINVHFSSQKPETVTRLENSDPTIRILNERSANEPITCTREFIGKFQLVQKGIREEKHVIRNRLSKLEDVYRNDQNDTRVLIASNQRSILDKVETLQNDQNATREDVASKQQDILDKVEKLQNDQMTLQSKVASQEITIDNQKREIQTLKAIIQSKTLTLILDGWTQYSNSVYKAFNNLLNWTNAMTSCQSFGGFLAEIQSEDENNFVKDLVDSNKLHFWLGGCDRETEGEWKWCHTNDDITYDGWYTGQPDNWHGGEDCMHGYRKDPRQGKWNDIRCHHSYVYVCEVPIAT